MRALAASALLVVAVLTAAVMWFALNPDPMGGEPSVIVAIDAGAQRAPDAREAEPAAAGAEAAAPEAAPDAASSTPDASQGASAPNPAVVSDDPSGLAGSDPGVPAPDPGEEAQTTSPPLGDARAEPADAAAPPPSAPAAPEATTPPPRAAKAPSPPPEVAPLPKQDPPAKVAAIGPLAIPQVPDGLVEASQFGPLPRVATDGRRPADVYARPAEPGATVKSGGPARVAILINGLGLSESVTGQAITSLPGAVTLAFGVYGRDVQDWVGKARTAGHEVMLQIPLEPYDYPDNDPGPHTLLTKLSGAENVQRLQWLMSRFTGYVGVTNYMGAKFVTSDGSVLPVLEEIKARGLVYLDDGAAAKSAAGQVATGIGLPFSVAQVQLDAVPVAEEVTRSLASLEAIAKERGLAIGVGSALPMTIDQVDKWVEGLAAKGILLIPITAAIRVQHQS